MGERVFLPSSDDLVKLVKSEVDDLILYFSCGKESIAMWLWLRDKGFKITPVFLFLVPGLRSDEKNLVYYEEFFGCRIMRFPHPLLYQMLNHNVFQPPERVGQIAAFDLPNFSFADIDKVIAHRVLSDAPYFSAMGMRMADNLERRMMMYQNGVLGRKNRRFYYPIWDWKIDRLADVIVESKIKIPKAYKLWGAPIS